MDIYTLIVLIGFIMFGLFLRVSVVNIAKIKGHSMNPSLHHNDIVVVNKFLYRFREPRVGEVVMIRDPEERVKFLVKRVGSIHHSQVKVYGDNKQDSRDSHDFGDIHIGKIEGRVEFILFNPKQPRRLFKRVR